MKKGKRKRKAVLRTAILLFAAAAIITGCSGGKTLTEIEKSYRDPDVEAVLETMSLEEKVGQMFMGCFYSKTPSGETVEKYHLGGVLLFGASFDDKTKDEVKEDIAAIDEACTVTPVITVDEEGGLVTRVSGNEDIRKDKFKSPRDLYAKGGLDAILDETHEKNQLLSELGIDMNLAPVCDISTDKDDFMYSRSLGKDAETTADYISEVIELCAEDNMGSCLKHFPGYGNSDDTHHGMAVDDRSLTQLEENDLLPFKAGIDAGAEAVLVSHNIVTAIDEDLPASMSPAVNLKLRSELGFDGVVMTDDLSMGAIDEFLSGESSAVTAVMAGNDMLCTGKYAQQYDAVLSAVKDGLISEDRIDRSVRRIIRMKIDMGMLKVPKS